MWPDNEIAVYWLGQLKLNVCLHGREMRLEYFFIFVSILWTIANTRDFRFGQEKLLLNRYVISIQNFLFWLNCCLFSMWFVPMVMFKILKFRTQIDSFFRFFVVRLFELHAEGRASYELIHEFLSFVTCCHLFLVVRLFGGSLYLNICIWWISSWMISIKADLFS